MSMAHGRDGGAGGAAHAAWHSHWTSSFLEAVPISRVRVGERPIFLQSQTCKEFTLCLSTFACERDFVSIFMSHGFRWMDYNPLSSPKVGAAPRLSGRFFNAPSHRVQTSSPPRTWSCTASSVSLLWPSRLPTLLLLGGGRPPSDPGSGWAAEELGEGWDGWGCWA